MKKLFISQPMRDKTEKEIKTERQGALQAVRNKFGEDIELINTYFKKDPPENIKHPGLWYLGKSIVKMADADIVYFCKDWQKYRGCKCEYSAALEYGLEIITADYL